MEYPGDDGAIIVDGQHLTITHTGLGAKVGGLAPGQPWRIPLQAVSGAKLKKANRWTNSGWLSLGIGGIEPPQQKLTEYNAQIITFRYKANEHFVALYEWLLTVIERNQAEGIDPSTVEFEAAPGLVEKQRKAAEKAQGEEEKLAELVGVDRPDIIAAVGRMTYLQFAKRELKNLTGHLHDGETVRCLAEGTFRGTDGILVVLTDVRLLTVHHGPVSQGEDDFPLRLITSVSTSAGLIQGDLQLFVAGGRTSTITKIVKSDLEPLADAIREGIAMQHSAASRPPEVAEVHAPLPPEDDPYEALRKLASLRDDGVLTKEEYEAKKRELLRRI